MVSTALSLGTISPRSLYWETLKAMMNEKEGEEEEQSSSSLWCWEEPTKESSPGHHWLLMHLGIRDYFQFHALKERKCEFIY
jgi:deoxyribodipyrimidine photolyase